MCRSNGANRQVRPVFSPKNGVFDVGLRVFVSFELVVTNNKRCVAVILYTGEHGSPLQNYYYHLANVIIYITNYENLS